MAEKSKNKGMKIKKPVRLPFLDHNLVEFVFSLPDRFLVRDGWTKWILRNAFRDFLPAEIGNRIDKLGYMPPQAKWLGDLVWKDVMVDQLEKLSNNKQIWSSTTLVNA